MEGLNSDSQRYERRQVVRREMVNEGECVGGVHK